MVCLSCGTRVDEPGRFCRKCGTDFAVVHVAGGVSRKNSRSLSPRSKDPDELTGNGIGAVIMGDGFLMVAAILSSTHTAISSLLWVLLLIPAFGFFGKGFADVLLAKQIRRRLKQAELDAVPAITAPSTHETIALALTQHPSGELIPGFSVTERTTRELKT